MFDDKIRVVEPHGEVYWGCPLCRSWDVDEAEYCDYCGEAWPVNDMDYNKDGAFICSRCREEEEDEDC